jgi:hypothetical protein
MGLSTIVKLLTPSSRSSIPTLYTVEGLLVGRMIPVSRDYHTSLIFYVIN